MTLALAATLAPFTSAYADFVLTRTDARAPEGFVEVRGVAAGAFDPALWEADSLNWHFDIRQPMLGPKPGAFRNIYAPMAVREEKGWRIFYGAWDGTESGNDRIYTGWTDDFLSFRDRHMVVDHGDFIHVCNCCAIRLPSGEYRLAATGLLHNGHNRPVAFSSPDGLSWNGEAPHVARIADLLQIEGYGGIADADINGMNAILFEDGAYRLYFGDFRNFTHVFRATSTDFKRFTFDGPALQGSYAVNDVRRFDVAGKAWYLMGLHMNGDRLWYSLSRDGVSFGPVHVLTRNASAADRYIVAIGFVREGDRLLGVLYGAGATSNLCENRLFAKWLQKRALLLGGDGILNAEVRALGPDRALLQLAGPTRVRLQVLAEDGRTVLVTGEETTFAPGDVWRLTQR